MFAIIENIGATRHVVSKHETFVEAVTAVKKNYFIAFFEYDKNVAEAIDFMTVSGGIYSIEKLK